MGKHVLILGISSPPDSGLRSQLAESGFTVDEKADIDSAARWLRDQSPVCIFAHVADPDDASLCHELRELSDAPIMAICTERNESLTVRCLEAGADRVLLAPLSRMELVARIEALVGRQERSHLVETPAKVYRVSGLVIDAGDFTVTKAGAPVSLTPTEFRLLAALARRAGEVVSHQELIAEVWNGHRAESPESLRLYVHYLRQKLGDDQDEPRLLLSQRGIGYRLAEETAADDGKGSAHGQHEPGIHSGNARTRGPVRARPPLAAGPS